MKTLKELFIHYKERPFLFVRPGGNFGDHLIYFGAEILANQVGIQFETIDAKTFSNRDLSREEHVIYIHGGGAFNSWSSDAGFASFKQAIHSQAADVIYGPCTCSTDIDFLRDKFSSVFELKPQKNITIFAREKTTQSIFNDIDSLKNNAQVFLDCDTAFHATKNDLIELAGAEKNDYCLYGYRQDKELKKDSVKASFQYLLVDPPHIAKSFEHWVKIHLNAKEIITNRTHSSIIGAILGKPTTLFPSRYHKNKSIWQYNLKDMGVKWIEHEEAEELVQPSSVFKFMPQFIRSSWKLNRIAQQWRKLPEA